MISHNGHSAQAGCARSGEDGCTGPSRVSWMRRLMNSVSTPYHFGCVSLMEPAVMLDQRRTPLEERNGRRLCYLASPKRPAGEASCPMTWDLASLRVLARNAICRPGAPALLAYGSTAS